MRAIGFNKISKLLISFSVVFAVIILYFLTVRGNFNVPTISDINAQHSKSGVPFESSQEGSRYAMILSLVNDHAVTIDKFPEIGTPDVGKIRGHYYSLFPPALSLLAIPLYLLGLQIGATQMLTFLVSTIFAILTMFLIYKFCRKLDLHWSIGLFSAFAFGFATNAWGYSVTLYAHTTSAFLLLAALYVTFFWEKRYSFLKTVIFGVLYAVASFVDYPNLAAFLPLAIYFFFSGFSLNDENEKKIKVRFSLVYFVAPLTFVLLMGVYGYYNFVNFGSPFQLSNSLPRVTSLTEVKAVSEHVVHAVPALNTRSLMEGFHSFLVSHDRGILIYSPIVLLFAFGIGYFKEKKQKRIEGLLVAVVLMNLVTYSMFGDPYGGWAFGSRYMIAVLPELCILVGVGLSRFSKNILVKIAYSLVFIYSAGVSLLAPLTTNVIPPFVEARGIGLDSSYIINIRMLQNSQLNSFVYNHLLLGVVPGVTYYFIVLAIVLCVGLPLIWIAKK